MDQRDLKRHSGGIVGTLVQRDLKRHSGGIVGTLVQRLKERDILVVLWVLWLRET